MARVLGFAFILAAIVIASLVAGGAQAASPPEVRITDTDPPLTRNLNLDQALYLHLRYRSEVALRAQVKGFFEGVEIVDGARWNPSPAYPAGEGEAIVWIAYSKPARL